MRGRVFKPCFDLNFTHPPKKKICKNYVYLFDIPLLTTHDLLVYDLTLENSSKQPYLFTLSLNFINTFILA